MTANITIGSLKENQMLTATIVPVATRRRKLVFVDNAERHMKKLEVDICWLELQPCSKCSHRKAVRKLKRIELELIKIYFSTLHKLPNGNIPDESKDFFGEDLKKKAYEALERCQILLRKLA